MDKKQEVITPKLAVYKKLAALQSKLFAKKVKKSGRNDFSKYDYVTKEDILDAIKDEVRKSGLLFIPMYRVVKNKNIEMGGKVVMRSKVEGVMQIIDAESGGIVEIPMWGYAEDTQDKALWKAYTGMQKYFWSKLFNLMDFEKGSEPENDDPRTATAGRAASGKTRKLYTRKSQAGDTKGLQVSDSQKKFIRRLGGNPEFPKNKGQASKYISDLLKSQNGSKN